MSSLLVGAAFIALMAGLVLAAASMVPGGPPLTWPEFRRMFAIVALITIGLRLFVGREVAARFLLAPAELMQTPVGGLAALAIMIFLTWRIFRTR